MQRTSVVTNKQHACRCCGAKIKPDFAICLGCHRKREKVFNDCVAAGKSKEWAKQRVNEIYPFKCV